MGCRAIRICLTRPEIFKTQLRALFRASAFGNISIMYPMIISVEEVHQIKEIVAEVKQELTEQGVGLRRTEAGYYDRDTGCCHDECRAGEGSGFLQYRY